ncbi:MAG: hypothetical protein ACREGR_05210 [Minisyncoccia bacterium]
MHRTDLIRAIGIRVVALMVAFAFVLLLPPYPLWLAVVVLGQGHFFLAYLYQIEAGKWTPRRTAILFAWFALILWALVQFPVVVAAFITGVGFLVHFALDEARLLSEKPTLYTTLESMPFVALYSALLSDALLKTHLFWPVFFGALGIIALYGIVVIARRRKPNAASYAFAGWFLVTLVVHALWPTAPSFPLIFFWGLVLVHYSIWYGVYWFRLEKQPARRTDYIQRVALVNVFLVLPLFLWTLGGVSFLFLLFAPIMFDVWTFHHGIASLRGNEESAFSFS